MRCVLWIKIVSSHFLTSQNIICDMYTIDQLQGMRRASIMGNGLTPEEVQKESILSAPSLNDVSHQLITGPELGLTIGQFSDARNAPREMNEEKSFEHNGAVTLGTKNNIPKLSSL